MGKGWGSASNVLTLANWELHTLGYYWELIIPLSTLPYCSVDGGEKEREIYILFSVPAADLASPGPQDQSTIPRHTANHIVILLYTFYKHKLFANLPPIKIRFQLSPGKKKV